MLPGVTQSCLPVLLLHLGSEPYTLRSAVVSAVASVAAAAIDADQLASGRASGGGGGGDGDGEDVADAQEALRLQGRVVSMDARARGVHTLNRLIVAVPRLLVTQSHAT